jgi:MFS family permease
MQTTKRNGDSIDYRTKERSLKNSIYEGGFSLLTQGFTLTYRAAFALALGANATMIGLLASIPQLFSSLFQLLSIKATDLLKSRKMILVFTSITQALLWMLIIFIPAFAKGKDYLGPILFLIILTLSVAITEFEEPIRTSWINSLLPEKKRGKYFGKRNQLFRITTLISTILAGIILNIFKNNTFIGFGLVFSLVIISRITASGLCTQIYEPSLRKNKGKEKNNSLFSFLARLNHSNFGKYTLYITTFRIGAAMAGAFIAMHMLENLGFNYLTFSIMQAASMISSFFFMKIWGRIIDQRGSTFVMAISGMMIPLIPFFWIYATSPVTVFLIQVFAGISWAGFNISTSTFTQDSLRDTETIKYMAYQKFLLGIGVFIGANFGAVIVNIVPKTWMLSPIQVLLVFSTIVRFASSLFFLPQIKEERFIQVNFGRLEKNPTLTSYFTSTPIFTDHINIQRSETELYKTHEMKMKDSLRKEIRAREHEKLIKAAKKKNSFLRKEDSSVSIMEGVNISLKRYKRIYSKKKAAN